MIVIPQIKVEENEQGQNLHQIYGKGPFRLTKGSEVKKEMLPKSSEWSILENAKYAAFIEANFQKMEGKPHGKLWMIHQEMAKFIKTRNFRQCKLHHQRMSNSYGKIPQILSYFNVKFPQFESLMIREKENLENSSRKQIESRTKTFMSSSIFAHEKFDKEDEVPTDFKYRDEEQIQQNVTKQKNISDFPSTMPKGLSIPSSMKAEKWQQCHRYFLEWTSRLNYLMGPYQTL